MDTLWEEARELKKEERASGLRRRTGAEKQAEDLGLVEDTARQGKMRHSVHAMPSAAV